MKNYSDFDRVKVVKPLRTKITTVLGIPSNGISFSGQKRHASEKQIRTGRETKPGTRSHHNEKKIWKGASKSA